MQKIYLLLLTVFVFNTTYSGKAKYYAHPAQSKHVNRSYKKPEKQHKIHVDPHTIQQPHHTIVATKSTSGDKKTFAWEYVPDTQTDTHGISTTKPYRSNQFSKHQRMPFVLFILMLLLGTVDASPLIVPPAVQYLQYLDGKVFGPCEKLIDGSILCSSIEEDYTVTTCVHSGSPPCLEEDRFSTEGLPDIRGSAYIQRLVRLAQDPCLDHRCLSFDSNGIHGEHQNRACFDIKLELDRTERECVSGSRTIVNQLHELKPIEIHVTDDGGNHTCLFFDDTNYPSGLRITTTLSNGAKIHCDACVEKMLETRSVTRIIRILKTLYGKFNLSFIPVKLVHDSTCDPQSAIIPPELLMDRICILGDCKDYNYKLKLSRKFLDYFSDQQIYAVIAHEVHHIKQSIAKSDTRNNSEAEADLAALLASHNSCLAHYLISEPKRHRSFPMITQENADKRLVGPSEDDPHPPTINRISFILIMHAHYQEVLRRLLHPEIFDALIQTTQV